MITFCLLHYAPMLIVIVLYDPAKGITPYLILGADHKVIKQDMNEMYYMYDDAPMEIYASGNSDITIKGKRTFKIEQYVKQYLYGAIFESLDKVGALPMSIKFRTWIGFTFGIINLC